MSNTERQLRQTIEYQDKEICLLRDQLNRLTDINNNLWNLFIEQSKEIKREEPEYAEAQRLLDMLKYIKTIPANLVPTNSLLKEFVGGGDFKY